MKTDLASRYARVWVFVAIGLLSAFSIALLLGSEWSAFTATQQAISLALGTSLLASVIAYALLSLLVEPRLEELRTQRITSFAITEANDQFRKRFSVSLPSATYGASQIPKPEFRSAMAGHLENSTRYDYKGDSATFTSFRLTRLAGRTELRRLEDVRLCLLDPTADTPIRAQAEHRSKARTLDVSAVMSELRTDIFVTLVALFDIRDMLSTTVYFHNDLPFFRCEMFDSGMFLTYYVGRAEFPETLEFTALTKPYAAYRRSLELSRRFARSMVRFSVDDPSEDLVGTEDELTTALEQLGCEHDLPALRAACDRRFRMFSGELKRANISPDEIF